MSNVCEHSTTWAGLCVACGADVTALNDERANAAPTAGQPPSFVESSAAAARASNGSTSSGITADKANGAGVTEDAAEAERLSVLHGDHRFQVSREEAERIHAENAVDLVKKRRLILVLDLDNTLIHATTGDELLKYKLMCPQVPHDTDEDFKRDGVAMFSLPPAPERYLLKQRPYLKEFMQLTDKFEFHMYTHGTRNYAHRVAKFIDPDGTLFKNRVLSRDDCKGSMMKTLDRLFPIDESMCLVVDDRTDVWQDADNVINIPAYGHFYRNKPNAGPFYVTESEPDSCLLYVKSLLERIHADYYKYASSSLPM